MCRAADSATSERRLYLAGQRDDKLALLRSSLALARQWNRRRIMKLGAPRTRIAGAARGCVTCSIQRTARGGLSASLLDSAYLEVQS